MVVYRNFYICMARRYLPDNRSWKDFVRLNGGFRVAIIAVPTGIISSGFVESGAESADDDKKLQLLKEIQAELKEIKKDMKK